MLTHGNTHYRRRPSHNHANEPFPVAGMPSADLHADLARRDDAPGTARTLIRSWCDGLSLGDRTCDTVRLLVSELVTNAVRHPDAPPESVVELAASYSDESVLVTVTDAGTGAAPLPRTPDPVEGGYGLFLLEQEATQWGVDRASEGTRVWFQLDALWESASD